MRFRFPPRTLPGLSPLPLSRDDRGAIAPMIGLMIAVLGGFTGLAVDLGLIYHERQRLRSAADLAAIAAVRAADATGATRASLAGNGYANPNNLAVQVGTYKADKATSVGSRFSAGGTIPNAAQVGLDSTIKAVFSRLVGGPSSYTVSARATAVKADLASFGIGSRLASLDGGIANALLTALLGTNVNAYLVDYNGLADVKVDMANFLAKLALRANIQADSYQNVLNAKVGAGPLLGALIDAARDAGAGSNVLNYLAAVGQGPVAGVNATVGDLLSVGVLADAPMGSTETSVGVGLAQILSALGAVSNGQNPIVLDLAAAPLGLAKARISLRLGEKWQSSGLVLPGASVTTAQVRLLLEVWVNVPLLGSAVRVPIYVEAARGTAQLTNVSCPWTSSTDRSATLSVNTGLAFLAITDTAGISLDPASPRPAVRSASLVSLPLVSVTGSTSVEVGSSQPQSVTFSDNDIRTQTIKTVSSWRGSPTATLLANLNLNVNVAGLLSLGLGGLSQAISGALLAVSPALDLILSTVLDVAGIRLAAADVAVEATRCGGAVLVQ